jgi:DNA-binding winged helix-turn-helix (wHTH) protein
MPTNGHLTKTQYAIIHALSDGQGHSKDELLRCLPDDLASVGAVRVHVCRINKVLRPMGEEILCVYDGRTVKYRHIRHIGTS